MKEFQGPTGKPFISISPNSSIPQKTEPKPEIWRKKKKKKKRKRKRKRDEEKKEETGMIEEPQKDETEENQVHF